MTRKHLTRRTIESSCSEPCINRGVLDIRVSEPILHKRQVCTSIKQVCRNRMLQAMELPLFHGQACSLAIRLHEMVEHVAAYGYVAIRDKEIGRFIRTRPQ